MGVRLLQPFRLGIHETPYFLMFKEVKYEAVMSFISPTNSHTGQLGSFQFECWALSPEVERRLLRLPAKFAGRR